MNYIKQIFMVLFIAGGSYFAAATASTNSDLPLVKGQVRDLAVETGEITIKHAPIPNLNMMGMTMVFQAGEGVDISKFNKGDKVDITVVEKDGNYMIMSIVKSE